MFIQVIQGKTTDAEALRRQHQRWIDELSPGAPGYLGVTGGVAEDGTVLFMARFEDEGAARANSERAEQGAWWEETKRLFDGDVKFHDCTDVDLMDGGGSDQAGFVQVMQGRVTNKDRLRELEQQNMDKMREMRPDVIGGVRAWDGDRFTHAIYFNSEEEARKGEATMGDIDSSDFQEFMGLMSDMTYIDLKDPWLHTA